MIKNTLLTCLVATILFACEPDKTRQANNVDTTKNQSKDTIDIEDKIQKVTSDLPSPVDFISHIEQAKLEYNAPMLNSTGNVNNYLGVSQKTALNLGIYMTDLGYTAAYFKSSEALGYLKAIKKLSDQLGILDDETKKLVVKFEKNMENRDSLLSVSREGYFSIDNYLRKSERKDLASLILAGSWIEGLYVTSKVVKAVKDYDTNDKVKPILWRIGGQKRSLDNLVNIISKLESNDNTKKLLEKLKNLQKVYQKVKVEEGSGEDVLDISEIKDATELNDKTVINTIKKVEISKETFEEIAKQINELREFVVSK
jgi:hypothetical protein